MPEENTDHHPALQTGNKGHKSVAKKTIAEEKTVNSTLPTGSKGHRLVSKEAALKVRDGIHQIVSRCLE
jgi:hypothetical protein